MSDDLHIWVVLLLVTCMVMLAAINIYLVMQQIKGPLVAQPSLAQGQKTNLDYERHLEHISGQLLLIQTELTEVKMQMPATEEETEIDTGSLFQLDTELNASLTELEQTDGSTEALLLDLQQAKADELSAWRDSNAERIVELMAQQKQLRGRIASLQSLLSEANATVLTLRSRTRRTPISDAANDKTLITDLQQSRKTIARLENELSAANTNMQTLTERIATRELMLAEAGEQHDKERAGKDAQIAELQARIQGMQAIFDRTLVEKTFIEDAFLEEIEGSKPS